MSFQHILLTTDLSPESTRPYEPVRDLAQALGARLTLLSVVLDLQVLPHGAPFAPAVSSPDLEKEIEDARAELAKHREDLGADLEIATDVIGAPDIALGICGYAKHHGVDLIALSTHGRKGWKHLALGSVAEKVLRNADVPVLSFHRPNE